MQTYNENQPSFHILICLIQIWNMDKSKKKNPMEVPKDAMIITEVEEIEIDESYKKLIGTASVKFPRGTVIRRTVTEDNYIDIATHPDIQANVSSAGVVEEIRKEQSSVATVGSFNTGDRIRIYLGYTTDPEVARQAKMGTKGKTVFNDNSLLTSYSKTKGMTQMFDGYITKISVDTPIELHCENLASKLKEVTCPKLTLKGNNTVKDFLDEGGKHYLLKDTGLKLYSKSKEHEFNLGKITLTPDLTVADVLTEWAKFGLHCFITTENGTPEIVVGRSYFDNAKTDSIINATTKPSEPTKILFNYHVANNNLELTSSDKKFLAIEAEGLAADDKFIHLTLLQNPKYDPSDKNSTKWRVVNESKLSKKAMKLGARPLSQSSGDKVSMNLYSKRPFHSRTIPIDKDKLLEEAIKYFESYNMNGIEGSLVLFGDLAIRTGTKVELVDDRYPGKNGYYLVDEVNTTFGTGGYRQTIKMPYCISRKKVENNGTDKNK